MISITQFFIRTVRPVWCAFLTKLLYSGKRVSIGADFRTDSIPRIIIDKGCVLNIGSNVEFRRNIEIRVHGQSTVTIGNNTRIDRGVRILSANKSNILIDDGARIGLYSVLNGGDSISVGRKALISGFVYLQTSMHGFNTKEKFVQDQGYQHAPVILEEDSWLGTHVVVLPGITIGKGAIVGSNAVVTKSVKPYYVVAGVPAVPLKDRE